MHENQAYSVGVALPKRGIEDSIVTFYGAVARLCDELASYTTDVIHKEAVSERCTVMWTCSTKSANIVLPRLTLHMVKRSSKRGRKTCGN